MVDKRSISRNKKRIPVRFGTDEYRHMGYTDDVSPGGIFIQTTSVLKPGGLLQVQLNTQDGEVILFTGQIRWAKRVPAQLIRKIKAGMGVKIMSFQQGEEIFRSWFPGE